MSSVKWGPFCLILNVVINTLLTIEPNIDGVSMVARKGTVKPVCNDHLSNKIYYLQFIQYCVLMKTEGTDLLLLTIPAIWSSFRWPLAT